MKEFNSAYKYIKQLKVSKNSAGYIAQVSDYLPSKIGTEFKPQYCKNKCTKTLSGPF
jgi:hypothetical protein